MSEQANSYTHMSTPQILGERDRIRRLARQSYGAVYGFELRDIQIELEARGVTEGETP